MIMGFSSDPRQDRDDAPSWNPIFTIIGTGVGGKPK